MPYLNTLNGLRVSVINLAYWFDAPYAYSGGLNYLSNLLYALSKVNGGEIKPYIFFGTDVPQEVLERFKDNATIVRTKILQRFTFQWLAHKLLYRFFRSMLMINFVLKKNNIDILSHVWFPYFGRRNVKVITWIPDLQYLHLPEMFPGLDIKKESEINRKIATSCDALVVSSDSALKDLLAIVPRDAISPVSILRFVSQSHSAKNKKYSDISLLEKKYGFYGNFFLLPNQFWAHKNHQIVIEALTLAKQEGLSMKVLMTGNTIDYRLSGTPYIDSLRKLIAANALEDCARILGMIDYPDLLSLMRNCVAVINPSKFEGWSSSVEEAKSMGKNIILSKIPVHIEQAPEYGAYFDCEDAVGLKNLMINFWNSNDQGSNIKRYEEAQNNLIKRTIEFGGNYLELIKSVVDFDNINCKK